MKFKPHKKSESEPRWHSSRKPYVDQNQKIENKICSLIINDIKNYITGPNILLLGYADDDWPYYCLKNKKVKCIDIIEINRNQINKGRKRFKHKIINFHEGTFENYNALKKYNTVIAGSVIELYKNPKQLLQKIHGWLLTKGRLILTTPNKYSLHKKIGVKMGIEKNFNELSYRAKMSNDKRTYGKKELIKVLNKNSFKVNKLLQKFLKPVPNSMLKDVDKKFLLVLLKAGDEYNVDFLKELIAICTKSR